ncbi:MAG: hypothetical protein MUF81_20565 [Verrucomicrobia bacterium]|nr:hypothetical protein [Verrucomicrobiota bacterium]
MTRLAGKSTACGAKKIQPQVESVSGQEVEELGEAGAAFVHKVKNRWLAVEHPQGSLQN